MRIAFCMLRSAIDRRDGGAESIRNLIDGISQSSDLHINVVSSSGHYPHHRSYAPHPWSDSKALSLIGHFYRTVQSVARDHDLLVLILPNPAFGYLADLVKRRVKKPVIVNYESHWHTANNFSLLGDNLSWQNVSRLIVFNRMTSSLSRGLCNRYIVSTHFQKDELIKIGYDSTKIDVIPNCTNIDKYHYSYRANDGRTDGHTIMYLGHFNHSKGVDLLVQSMPTVLNYFPRTKLVLIWYSGGKEYLRIKKLIKKHGLLGNLELINKIVDVPTYLSRADVFALPYRSLSKTRIIPSVLLEAFSIGVPLVVCNCTPLSEIVDDHKTGIIAPADDPHGLGLGIVALLEDATLRQQIVQYQREVAKDRYSHTVVAEQYKQLLMEILHE